MIKKIEPLSKVPSKAIIQALEDLEWAERNPEYNVNMSIWHTPEEKLNEKLPATVQVKGCSVCMAGSVLAHRYINDPKVTIGDIELSEEFDADLDERLRIQSFDDLRTYDFDNFLRAFDVPDEFRQKICDMRINTVIYDENPDVFKANMRMTANRLDVLGY